MAKWNGGPKATRKRFYAKEKAQIDAWRAEDPNHPELLKIRASQKVREARYRAKYPEKAGLRAKKWRKGNPDGVKAQKRASAQKKIAVMREAKDIPCADCNTRYPYYVMQFDHLGSKAFPLNASGVQFKSYARIKAEIAKCEPVCANCHMIRSQMRLKPEMFYAATPENYWLQFGRWVPNLNPLTQST